MNENNVPAGMPLMCEAFRTCYSSGAAGQFVMEFKFKSLADLHAADDEWLAARAAAPVAQASAVPPAQPAEAVLPHPGGVEISALLDSILSEYNWPSNPKNAARAGWAAAMRYLATQPLASRELGPYFEEQPDGTLLPIGPDEYDTTQPLAAPVQQTEAVGEIVGTEKRGFALMTVVNWEPGFNRTKVGTKLYATPPTQPALPPVARVPLTDAQLDAMWTKHCKENSVGGLTVVKPAAFARAVLAAHGIEASTGEQSHGCQHPRDRKDYMRDGKPATHAEARFGFQKEGK